MPNVLAFGVGNMSGKVQLLRRVHVLGPNNIFHTKLSGGSSRFSDQSVSTRQNLSAMATVGTRADNDRYLEDNVAS